MRVCLSLEMMFVGSCEGYRTADGKQQEEKLKHSQFLTLRSVSYSHVCECSYGISSIARQECSERLTPILLYSSIYRLLHTGNKLAIEQVLNYMFLNLNDSIRQNTLSMLSVCFSKRDFMPSDQEFNMPAGYLHLFWKPRHLLRGRRALCDCFPSQTVRGRYTPHLGDQEESA